MLKKIAIAVAVLIAVLLLVVSLQPSTFQISRTGDIHAPPEAVFGILNDLHQGGLWSPFEQSDPEMKKTYSGPETGAGATCHWEGNQEAGAGTMTIEEARPNELVRMKLEMTRPMNSTSEVRFELAPSPSGTQVTWIMEGKNSFASKAFCMFVNVDQMLGSEFEEGLKNLEKVAQDYKLKKASSSPSTPKSPPKH